jgi:ribosomal protein S20
VLADNKKRLDSELENKKQQCQKEVNDVHNEAYKIALANATKAVENYDPNASDAWFKEISFKSSLKTYGKALWDENLKNQYKQTVNKILSAKGLGFTL